MGILGRSLVPSLLALLLVACGGGSGDGGGGRASSVSIDQAYFDVDAYTTDSAPHRSALLTVTNPPRGGLYVGLDYGSSGGLEYVEVVPYSDTTARLEIYFKSPSVMPAATRYDTITVFICVDERCTRQISGSPLYVSTRYSVATPDPDPDPDPGPGPGPGPGPDPEPEWPEVPVLSRVSLEHDVVAAAYSRAFDVLLMVSSQPANTLHILSPANGQVHEIPLSKRPTSVAVAPDGLTAAVGHDALITHVDLATIGDPAAPPPVLLEVSAEVADLAVDGRGFIHVMPRVDQWVRLHSINTSTGEEQIGETLVYADGRIAVHPSGESVYVVTRGISPAKIEWHDVSSGWARQRRDSPYHGPHPACGGVWLSENGESIYTACGNTFRASADPELDMRYTGRMPLTFGEWTARIIALSQSDAAREILFIENDELECHARLDPTKCRTRLALFESQFLNRNDLYSIPPVEIDGAAVRHLGLFVFHSGNGAHRYMISRTDGITPARYYLSVLQ